MKGRQLDDLKLALKYLFGIKLSLTCIDVSTVELNYVLFVSGTVSSQKIPLKFWTRIMWRES
jgi:hypothetical protein